MGKWQEFVCAIQIVPVSQMKRRHEIKGHKLKSSSEPYLNLFVWPFAGLPSEKAAHLVHSLHSFSWCQPKQKLQTEFSWQVNLENSGCISITDAIVGACSATENETWPPTVTCCAVRDVTVSGRIRDVQLDLSYGLGYLLSTATPATPVQPYALLIILCLNPSESCGTQERCSVPAEMWPKHSGIM